jgi:hypothetical protein
MSQEFGAEAPVVPRKTKTPYVFAVIYDSEDGLKVQECASRPDAASFVNTIGADKVVRAYKVSEVIKLKTVVKL